MTIEGKFYRIIPSQEFSNFFDVELLHEVKGKNPRSEFKIEAYGLPLEAALKKCCCFAVNQKFKDEVITLKQYIDEYKKASEEIQASIRG